MFRKVGKTLKKAEQDVRHAVEKASVKDDVRDERHLAIEAFEAANKDLSVINELVIGKQATLKLTSQNLTSAELVLKEPANLKLKAAKAAFQTAEALLSSLLNAQSVIVAQQRIVSDERGNASSIPNEITDNVSSRSEAKSKTLDSCNKAQAAAKLIAETLKAVKEDEATKFDQAISQTEVLIEEAKEIQKTVEQAETITQSTGMAALDPKLAKRFLAVNRFALEEAQKDKQRIKELEAKLAQQTPPVLNAATMKLPAYSSNDNVDVTPPVEDTEKKLKVNQ